MFGQARGWDILARNKQSETDPLPMPVEHIPVAPKLSTIDSAHKNATALVKAMEQRKTHWQEQIRIATEELRQAEVVLAGAYQLQHTIEQGMTRYQNSAGAPVVHDEIDTTVSERVTDEEVKRMLRESMTGNNWAETR